MSPATKLVPLHIYVTPEQKLMLEKLANKKKCTVGQLMRSVLEAYLKYMDKAFMHPGEQDVMARIQKLEDRLVRLNLKGLHATGQLLYLNSCIWKVGLNHTGMNQLDFQTLLEKSKFYAASWLDNRPKKSDPGAA